MNKVFGEKSVFGKNFVLGEKSFFWGGGEAKFGLVWYGVVWFGLVTIGDLSIFKVQSDVAGSPAS